MADRPRFSIELILANGVTVRGIASQEDAEHMVATGAYLARRKMTDQEMQRSVIETQIAFSIEKDSGVFVMSSDDGREWLVANEMIVAASVSDSQMTAGSSRLGFKLETDTTES